MSTTIIIPSYNYGRFLSKCLNSIFNQTQKPDEIIVIDDCSSDNTPEVAKKYYKKIKYIRHSKNLGHIKTFNEGIKIAKSDLIINISADDWIEPTLIEKESKILNNNPEIGLVYAQAYTYKNRIKTLNIAKPAGFKSYIGRKQDLVLLLTQGCFIPCMTVMVRKSVYKKLGFWDEKLKGAQDYEMWIRIALKYPLAYIAEPLANYRIHKKNMHLEESYNDNLQNEYLYILSKYLKIKDPRITINVKKEAYKSFYLWAAANQISSLRISDALKFWQKAFLLNPNLIFSYSGLQPAYFLLKKLILKRV